LEAAQCQHPEAGSLQGDIPLASQETGAIDTSKILVLMRLRPLLPQAKEISNEVIPVERFGS